LYSTTRASSLLTHQFDPALPGNGLGDIGTNGNLINLPPPGGGDDELFQATVPALIEQAKPDIVIICGL